MARKHKLHAFWSLDARRLHVWSEHNKMPPNPRSRRRRKRAKVPTRRKHPFACRASSLTTLLEKLTEGKAPKGAASELVVLLPSGAQGPEPSPGLWRKRWRSTDGTVALAPWVVSTLVFTPSEAVELLLALWHKGLFSGVLGDDARAMMHMARLSARVMATGRVVPTLVSREAQVESLWRATVEDDFGDDVRMCELAMPPLGRSGLEVDGFKAALRRARKRDEGWGVVPMPSSRDVVLGGVEALVDAMARRVLKDVTLISKVLGRRTQWGRKTATPEIKAWLEALTDPEPALKDQRGDWEVLQGQLEEWFAQGDESVPPPFVLTFLLHEPQGESEWTLELLLEGKDDPNLTLPTRVLWGPKRKTGFAFDQQRMQEFFLSELQRAVVLHPPLEVALKAPKATGVELSAQEAWLFLRGALPELRTSGFRVKVPNWTHKPPSRLGLALTMQDELPRSSGLLGVNGVAQFNWAVALDGQTLTAEELDRLVESKRPLLKVRGEWVELRPDEIEKAISFLKDRKGKGEERLSLGDVMRIQAGVSDVGGALEVTAVEARGKIQELLEGKSTRMRLRKTPRWFEGELRPYQRRGVSWLRFMEELGLGVCLADDMGLGKTVQVLAALEVERTGARGKRLDSPGPTLIVCPLSVVGNWRREAERFTPKLAVHVHHGPDRLSEEALIAASKAADIVITTYGLVARDCADLERVGWHRVVLDEAQNIKNSTALQTQAVFGLEAQHRVALTGTPVENRLSELWSIMNFLNPGLLGTQREFRARLANPIERSGDAAKTEVLRKLVAPFILRRLKTDRTIIADLPEKSEFKVFCPLTREQVTLYQAIVEQMMDQIEHSEGIQRKGLVLAAMTRLKQICNHPAQFLQDNDPNADEPLMKRSGKLAHLDEILEVILDGEERALIFTQYTTMGHMLQKHLAERFGCDVLFLHGGVTQRVRERMVASFQSDEGPPIFIISLRAGGTGLTLTAASHVIHYDRWWNPAVENQATDRAYRIGQDKNVQVRKLICTGTLEERIDEMIDQKQALAESVIGSGESALTELDTDALREILTLSADVIDDGD